MFVSLPSLTADRHAAILLNRPHGLPVYAGSFIRKRQIVLDRELERQPRELARILVHELFHFACGAPGKSSSPLPVRKLSCAKNGGSMLVENWGGRPNRVNECF